DASNPEYRNILEQKVAERGVELLYRELKEIDPESAVRIHPNNVRRVIRALEIYKTTGKTMTEYLEGQKHELIYDVSLIGLTMEREKLYDRINHRVDLMIESGLLEEVSSFRSQGLRDCQSIQAIGYKELYSYLDGSSSLEEAIQQLKQNTRRYAKRQLTWFRNKMDVKWFDMSANNEFEEK
ncbi:tRNA (adenosine(37)-N6)-dimethylallyltransferase MiaA, partial [Aeromonas veronii]|nr:tRNA (adenosine(37)-N6)-dimethylallyltransferase MiaA [Aeromonas veronii]